MAGFHRSFDKATQKNSGGQILVEYVLLLVLVVAIAVALSKMLIKSDPSDPGASGLIVQAWSKMTQAIGADYADDLNDAKK